MWNGFIGQTIATSTRIQRHLGVALLVAALVICVLGTRRLANVVYGPVEYDDVKSLSDRTFIFRDFASVQGSKTVSTGIAAIERTTRNGTVESEKTTGEYMAMMLDGHILIVKAHPSAVDAKYIGRLVPLPDDVKAGIFSNMGDRDLEANTLPVMLDASEEYDEGGLVLGGLAAVVLLVLGLVSLFLAKRRRESPEKHPLCKALEQYGSLYTVVPQIDGEAVAQSSLHLIGGVTITQNWLVKCGVHKAIVMRRDELVWVYKKLTKHSFNFIPTGTTYSSVLRDSRGKLLEISDHEQQVENVLASLVNPMPWIIVGYNKDVEDMYNKARAEFAESVARRRENMISKL